jgi:hypothetical protein
MAKRKTKIVEVEATDLVPMDDDLPQIETGQTLPLPSAETVIEYFNLYKEMQCALDELLTDHLVEFPKGSGKFFRKKAYWLAIAQGFQLRVELVKEQRVPPVGKDEDGDFGHVITCRATDPRTGRFSDGDGTCYASEKSQKRAGIGATEHNVRAHAVTRAKSRAISSLVGFGEVSAEEIQWSEEQTRPQAPPVPEPQRRIVQPVLETDEPKVVTAVSGMDAVKAAADKAEALKGKPTETLDNLDGEERITNVLSKYAWDDGTVVYQVDSTRRKYTCIKEDVIKNAQEALDKNLSVSTDWIEKRTKKGKDGSPGRKYNALFGLEMNIPI